MTLASKTPALAEDFAGLGLVETDPTMLPVPNPTATASKAAAESQLLPETTQLLATGALAAAPAAPECVDSCGSSKAPASMRLSVTGSIQERDTWCVPASGRVILSGFGVTTPQATLAGEMRTDSGGTRGTPGSRLVRPLNNRQSRNTYKYSTDTANGAALVNRAVTDVYRYRSSMMLGVEGNDFPWWSQRGFRGGHAMAVYGYYTQNSGGLYLYDPLNRAGTGGPHTASGQQAHAASAKVGNQLVW